MLVVLYSPIPHGVAPQQSSTMLQTAVAKVLTLVQKAKKTAEKVILQFELLNTYYSKSSCKMSYTPKKTIAIFSYFIIFFTCPLSSDTVDALYSLSFFLRFHRCPCYRALCFSTGLCPRIPRFHRCLFNPPKQHLALCYISKIQGNIHTPNYYFHFPEG